MAASKDIPTDIDAYISAFPEVAQKSLRQLRAAIRKAAPEAEEVISYKMPAYKYHGMLVYFAAFKNHIGFYPTPSGIAAFKKDLSGFESSKGAVQFPLGEPLPLKLITRMVEFRVKENRKNEAGKAKRKK